MPIAIIFRSDQKRNFYLIVQQMGLLFFTIPRISLQVRRGNDPDLRLPGSLTPELPESPEGALFFAQILKLHIAYMRIYGV
jgi:hypothetical protein